MAYLNPKRHRFRQCRGKCCRLKAAENTSKSSTGNDSISISNSDSLTLNKNGKEIDTQADCQYVQKEVDGGTTVGQTMGETFYKKDIWERGSNKTTISKVDNRATGNSRQVYC